MFKKTILKKGLRIITFPMKNTRALTLLVLVATGSKYEVKKQNGISHLLEHMAFKGTKKRPHTRDIARELDRVGGVFNAFTDKEVTGFWIKVDATHFNLACDVLSDMIFNSLFKKAELAREKRVIFEEINMMKDQPAIYVLELWEKLLYGDQPAGWPIAGRKKILEKISSKDILDYLKNQFVAENIVISLAGNFKEKVAISKIKKFFRQFKITPPFKKESVVERQNAPRILIDFRNTDQAHLVLGVRAFDIFSIKRYPLSVMAVLLGGIMSSRLFIKVREKKGLAYYIKSAPKFYTDSGYFITHAGVNNQKTLEAIKIILREYKKLKTKKIPKSELKKAKENIKGKIYLNLETSDAWATYLGSQEILKKKILTPEQQIKLIDKVSQNDILKVAREIFVPNKLNLALIGPFKQKKKFEEILRI